MTKGNLRHHAVKGMQWAVLGRLLKSGLGLVTLAIISRWLTPAEFGAAALVMFIAGFGQLFVDIGLRAALVQRKDITELQKNTVFWASLALSLLIAGAMVLMAGPIARAFGAEAIAPLIRWMVLVFPIAALQGIQTTTLERDFAFAKLARADMASAVAGAVTAVALVIAGYGIGALIAQQLVQAVVGCVMQNAMARWRPAARFSIHEFRSLMGYAGYVMLSNVMMFFVTQLDRPIITGILSAQVLGYFTMAQQIVVAPFKVIVSMARKVLFPILASVQDDRARAGAAYLRIQYAMSALMAPACLGIGALAEPIVAVLLAPDWHPVAPLLRLVALQMLFIPIQEINQTTLTSQGHAKFQFWWMLVAGSSSLLALWLAAPYGIEAAILARLAVTAVNTPLLSGYTMRRMDLAPTALARTLAAPMVAAGAMFAAVIGAASVLPLPPVGILIVCIPLGVAVYGGLLVLLGRQRAMDLLDIIRKRGK